jgi:F0F1-type ATP synthase assembly protein I
MQFSCCRQHRSKWKHHSSATEQRQIPVQTTDPFSLSSFILIGFALGIFCGLFLGEYSAPLEVIGGAFIGLLQMTVLHWVD